MKLCEGTLAACLALAGCGGADEPPGPRLARALAADLSARSEAVANALARGDSCAADAEAARLQQAVVAAVNAGRVPPDLQEELAGAVNALAERIACVPPAPPPPAATEEDDGEDEGEGNGEGKGKEKAKGKGKAKGREGDD